jgi:hypothetical protein
VDDLFAAIAAFLRERNSRLVGATPARRYACRLCGQEYNDGAGLYHLAELVEAGTCAHCHQARLRQEAAGVGRRAARHAASAVAPRCRRCGEAITVGSGRFAVERLRADRACEGCYIPF